MHTETSTNSFSLDRSDVADIVVAYVSEFFFVEESRIAETSRFEEDLAADAFSYADCIDALEEEFAERALGFRLEDKERDELETVRDLVDAISIQVVVPNEQAGGIQDHA